jgi:hypothetical protein
MLQFLDITVPITEDLVSWPGVAPTPTGVHASDLRGLNELPRAGRAD